MRRALLLGGLSAILAGLAACGTRGTVTVEGTITIPNSLGFGNEEEGGQVQFIRVENDSRCAAGVQCVRAGEAFVVLAVTVDGGSPQASVIELAPGGQATLSIDRFDITVFELRPDPLRQAECRRNSTSCYSVSKKPGQYRVSVPIRCQICRLPGTAKQTRDIQDSQMAETVLIAHRGIDDSYPENTIPAFEAALGIGMGVEFDLDMTSDQHIVVIHDNTVDRTTNGTGSVAQMSLSEIRELDAGSWKGAQFTGTKIPTFDEVLALVADKASANPAIALDVKTLQPGIINMICAALDRHGLMDRTVGIGIIAQSVDVRRRFYEGSARFRCSNVAQNAETLALAVTDPYSSWIYGRFVPSVADVETVHSAGKRLFVSGDEVSKDVNKAYEAVTAGPDAVLTWHPNELHGRLHS